LAVVVVGEDEPEAATVGLASDSAPRDPTRTRCSASSDSADTGGVASAAVPASKTTPPDGTSRSSSAHLPTYKPQKYSQLRTFSSSCGHGHVSPSTSTDAARGEGNLLRGWLGLVGRAGGGERVRRGRRWGGGGVVCGRGGRVFELGGVLQQEA